jgi:hypothetical protein
MLSERRDEKFFEPRQAGDLTGSVLHISLLYSLSAYICGIHKCEKDIHQRDSDPLHCNVAAIKG